MKTAMRKWGLLFLSVAVIGVFVTPGFSAEQKAVTLKWAMPLTPIECFRKKASGLREEITRRTNGKVKFDFFWSGTLLKYQDIDDGCGEGGGGFRPGLRFVQLRLAPPLDHVEPGGDRQGFLGHAVGVLRYASDQP